MNWELALVAFCLGIIPGYLLGAYTERECWLEFLDWKEKRDDSNS